MEGRNDVSVDSEILNPSRLCELVEQCFNALIVFLCCFPEMPAIERESRDGKHIE